MGAEVGPAPAENTHDELARRISAARLATLGMFTAGIVHELNTPIGAISSNHDTLKRALLRLQEILADEVVEPHELAEVRRVVRALGGVLRVNELAVERVVRLVGDLRSFGAPDQAHPERVDVHDCIESALTILGHRIGERIRVERVYAELPEIECFPAELSQAFTNLIQNAAEAIPGEGRITIRSGVQGDAVTVQIRDTGTGIEAATLERIFEPGFTTKGARTGMGLGLLIVSQIIERHGGSIEAASVPGEGTTFTVRLPRRIPPGDAARAETVLGARLA